MHKYENIGQNSSFDFADMKSNNCKTFLEIGGRTHVLIFYEGPPHENGGRTVINSSVRPAEHISYLSISNNKVEVLQIYPDISDDKRYLNNRLLPSLMMKEWQVLCSDIRFMVSSCLDVAVFLYIFFNEHIMIYYGINMKIYMIMGLLGNDAKEWKKAKTDIDKTDAGMVYGNEAGSNM